ALIDLGIDSDGIINGQVLTADVETITSLDVADKFIVDLTGIEDFVSLVNLRIDFNIVTELDVTNLTELKFLGSYQTAISVIDLSNNSLLEEVYFGNEGDVSPMNLFEYIDLSNNPNIKFVDLVENHELQYINLNNGNNQEGMFIDVYRMFNSTPICIQVDDPGAANSNQYPYSTWDVYGEYYFSSE